MKNTKRILPLLLSLIMLFSLFAGSAVTAYADSDPVESDTIYFSDGFFCLHPHRNQQGAYDPVHMTAVPSEQYTEYPKETLDLFAGFIMMRQEYYQLTGELMDNSAIQGMIWHTVCTNSDHKNQKFHLTYGVSEENANNQAFLRAMKESREAYIAYVKENLNKIKDKYTMTIWVSSDSEYQDILELRLVEKHSVPTMEKKVLDRNDTDNTFDNAMGWNDAADYDIGDEVPYQITASLNDMPNFSKYYLEFVDSMEHLTVVSGSVKVTLDGNDVTDQFTITTESEPDGSAEKVKTTLRISCENILPLGAHSGSKVVVTYSATLNKDAIIGNPGNANEAYMLYTRSSGIADLGETPHDICKVFTYRLTANKVDPEQQKLAGAAFKLSKKLSDGTYKTVAVIGAKENGDGTYTLTDSERTEFVWNGIDDGTYKLEEVVTPIGYNTMEPVEFWIKAQHDHNAENPNFYWLETSYDGFIECYPPEWAELIGVPNAEGYVALDTSVLSTDIENRPGVVLPETGGMGTAPIYLTAVVMMFSAAFLLQKKRRA